MSVIVAQQGILALQKIVTQATPAVVQTATANSTAASQTVTLPNPSGGGVLLLFVSVYNTEAVTVPAGWTLIGGGDEAVGSSSPDSAQYIYARDAAAGDTGSTTVGFTNPSFGHICVLVEVSGASATQVTLDQELGAQNSEGNEFVLSDDHEGLKFALTTAPAATVATGDPWDVLIAGFTQTFAAIQVFKRDADLPAGVNTTFATGSTSAQALWLVIVAT